MIPVLAEIEGWYIGIVSEVEISHWDILICSNDISPSFWMRAALVLGFKRPPTWVQSSGTETCAGLQLGPVGGAAARPCPGRWPRRTPARPAWGGRSSGPLVASCSELGPPPASWTRPRWSEAAPSGGGKQEQRSKDEHRETPLEWQSQYKHKTLNTWKLLSVPWYQHIVALSFSAVLDSSIKSNNVASYTEEINKLIVKEAGVPLGVTDWA